MTDPKDDLPETDTEVPTKAPTPEPGIRTPDEGVPPEGEEETLFVDLEDEVPEGPDEANDPSREALDRRA